MKSVINSKTKSVEPMELLKILETRLFLRVKINLSRPLGSRTFEADIEATTGIKWLGDWVYGSCSFKTLGTDDTVLDNHIHVVDFGESFESPLNKAYQLQQYWISEKYDSNAFESAILYNGGDHTAIPMGHSKVLFNLIRFQREVAHYCTDSFGSGRQKQIAFSAHDRVSAYLRVQESKIVEAFSIARDFIN